MRCVILLALLGAALAAKSLDSRPLQPQKQYQFRYEAAIHSGLPMPSEVSASRLQALVNVQIPDEHSALLQLSEIRVASSHMDESNKNTPFESLTEKQNDRKYEDLLQLPVRFNYKNGLVSEITFSEDDQSWSENVKRSVINMLQLNIEQAQRNNGEFQLEEDKENKQQYNKQEKTIEGECEVLYTLSPEVQSEKVQITKTVNFEKCSARPYIRYNTRFASECRDCQDNELIQPQTVYTYTMDKQQLKTVEVLSHYTVTIKDQPLLQTEMSARLTLEKTSEIKRKIESPKGEKKTLLYSTEWEESVEQFSKNGDKSDVLPYEKYTEKVNHIKMILKQVSKMEDNKPETAHHLARLVRLVRMCSMSELETVFEHVYKHHDIKLQQIMIHTLAISGTKNTIQYLVQHVEKKNISEMKVAQLFKSIQETPYPSEQIADLLIHFAKTHKVERRPIIKQSVWLAIGSIVRGAIVAPTQEKNMVEENVHSNKQLKEKYLSIFEKQFEQASSTYEKILALKTIANAGIDLSVQMLEKIIISKQELSVRMEAIDSLRLLKDIMPKKIQRVLLPVYKNRLEKTELRQAALVQIMNTLPSKHIISQIISTMEREPSQQVAAFTYHTLTSIAKSTNPCHKRMSAEINIQLSFSRYQPESRLLSYFAQLPLFTEEQSFGLNFNLASLLSKDSFIPKELSASLDSLFGGHYNKYLAQIGFSQQNFEQIVNKILNRLTKMEKDETIVRGRRVQQTVSLLKELARKLNIRSRQTEKSDSYAMLYLRYKEMDFAVLPLDEKLVDEVLENYLSNGKFNKNALEQLLNGENQFEIHHAAYFHETVRKMPTILGLPVEVTGKMPTVFSAHGKISFEKVDYGFSLRLQAKPSLASTHVSSMRVWTPLFEQGVKIVRSIESQIPVDIKVEITNNKQFELTVTSNIPEQKKNLLRISSRPVAYLRFVGENQPEYVESEEKTLTLLNNQMTPKDIKRTVEVAGLKMIVSGHMMPVWTKETLLFGEQTLAVFFEPTSQTPKQIVSSMIVESLIPSNVEKTELKNVFDSEFTTEEQEQDEKDRRQNFHKMVREVEGSQGYKHRMSFKIEANGRSVERNAQMEIRTSCDKKVNYCKMIVDARRTPVESENRDWTLKSQMEIVLPQTPSTLQQLKDQKHREVQGLWEAKWGAGEKNQMSVKLQLEQTKEQKKWIRLAEKELKGVPAYELLIKAARLNQAKVVAEYEITPETQTYINRIWDLVKGYTFWSNEVTKKMETSPRRVTLQLTVEPSTRRLINLTVSTPEELVRMQNMNVPRLYLPSIARQSLVESVSSKAECEVKATKVSTFDDLVFRAPLTTCYSVIAKDCSEEPRFAVLVKKINNNSEKTKLKVIRDEIVHEFELVNEKIQVTIDGKKIHKESELQDKQIEMLSEELMRMQLEDVEVRFDGYTAKVHMSRRLQNQQCGLCGHFDGEKTNDFRKASDEETDNIEEFHRSFLVQDDECKVEESRLSEKKNYKIESSEEYEQEREYSEDYEQEQKNKNYDSSEEQEKREPKEETRVIEHSHRVCFSMEPVPVCPKGYKNARESDRKVRFTCERRSAETQRMISEARREPLRLLDNNVSFVEVISVPTECLAY